MNEKEEIALLQHEIFILKGKVSLLESRVKELDRDSGDSFSFRDTVFNGPIRSPYNQSE